MNTLSKTDIIFFSVLVGIVALIIIIYFLIPVLNKKKYKQARQELEQRETAYYANKGVSFEQKKK